MSYLIGCLLLISTIPGFLLPVSSHKCQSCFAQCPGASLTNRTHCDCNSGDTCEGEYCFARVELWQDEKIAAIQKGCANEAPLGETGCQYAGSGKTIECFCEGNECNTAAATKGWETSPLPFVECCNCNALSGDICYTPSSENTTSSPVCVNRCRGNYCLLDYGSDEQACGAGRPRLWSFLRTGVNEVVQGGTTCVRYMGGHRAETYGCTCTKAGVCNRRDRIDDYDEKYLKYSKSPTNFCYSLSAKSKHGFNETVFNSSTMCEGHFCFITLTTVEMVLTYLPEDTLPIEDMSFYDVDYYEQLSESYEYDYSHLIGPPQDLRTPAPLLENYGGKYVVRQKALYDLQAGCGFVDNPSKVVSGCYTEYAQSGKPLRKHCICSSHMCNYYFQLTGERISTLRSALRPTNGYGSRIERMGNPRVGPSDRRGSFVGRVKPTGDTYQESDTLLAKGSSTGTRQIFTHDLSYVSKTSTAATINCGLPINILLVTWLIICAMAGLR